MADNFVELIVNGAKVLTIPLFLFAVYIRILGIREERAKKKKKAKKAMKQHA
jgi:hypothetical protein